MKTLRLTVLPFLLTAGLLPATAKDRHFANDLTMQAKVEEQDGKRHIIVTRYDEDLDSHSVLYGELTDEGGGKYRYVNEVTEEDGKSHTITGTVKIENGSLSYTDLKDSAGKLDVPASGGPWKEMDAAALLRNTKARYEAADKLLNAAWDQAKTELGDKSFPPLRDDQRKWLKYRDAMSLKQVRDLSDDPEKIPDYKAVPDYWQSMTDYTVSRTPVLRAWSGKKVPPGKSGIYRDSYGGEATLEERKDGLHFEINVVRTPALNLGEISGVAKLRGDSASWTDEPKPDSDKVAKLRFKFNASRSLTIESENADSYHGHNAYFDGQYFKIAPLKPVEGARKEK